MHLHAKLEGCATLPMVYIEADLPLVHVHNFLADVEAPKEVAFTFVVIINYFFHAILGLQNTLQPLLDLSFQACSLICDLHVKKRFVATICSNDADRYSLRANHSVLDQTDHDLPESDIVARQERW